MVEEAPKVFISYARADSAQFAEELLAGLELTGTSPFLDRHDIAPGEDWESRLEALISASDTLVFVISPASVASHTCKWEIEKAAELSKRIIPVLALDTAYEAIPERLQRLNFILFNDNRSFITSLSELTKALKSDLTWLREHTRLSELARRWLDKSEAEELLLQGSELASAVDWLKAWTPGTVEPRDEVRKLVGASETAEAFRQNQERARLAEIEEAQFSKELALKRLSRRTTIGLVTAGVLSVSSVGLAWRVTDAERRAAEERRNRLLADERAAARLIEVEASRTDIRGQVVSYAASRGQLAADGLPGENSPYTSAVISSLENASASIVDGLMAAHSEVTELSPLDQRPYLSTNSNGDVFLMRQPSSRRLKALVVSVETTEGQTIPLANAERDAITWEDFLSSASFEVERLTNPTLDDFNRALGRLRFAPGDLQAPENTFALLFYSGFGFTKNGADVIATRDTEVDWNVPFPDNWKERVRSVRRSARIDGILGELGRSAAFSVAIFDTNFSGAIALD